MPTDPLEYGKAMISFSTNPNTIKKATDLKKDHSRFFTMAFWYKTMLKFRELRSIEDNPSSGTSKRLKGFIYRTTAIPFPTDIFG
jgi:hypothetical protein